MGSFNTVRAEAACPHCGRTYPVVVQFKYGNTWQFEYEIGDAIRWGGNDIGERGARSVVVAGVAETRCTCRFDGEWEFYVYIEGDTVVRVVPSDGRYDFATASDGYLVLEE